MINIYMTKKKYILHSYSEYAEYIQITNILADFNGLKNGCRLRHTYMYCLLSM